MFNSVMRFLSPSTCKICKENLSAHGAISVELCQDCFTELTTVRAIYCKNCGKPRWTSEFPCYFCSTKKIPSTNSIATYSYWAPYTSHWRKIILEQKANHCLDALSISTYFMINLLDEFINDMRSSGFALGFIPGSKKAVERRGWDPQERIVKSLGSRFRLPVFSLLKRKNNSNNKSLSREERSLYEKFEVDPDSISDLQKRGIKSLILIDDVISTGSSFSEAISKIHNFFSIPIHAMTLCSPF